MATFGEMILATMCCSCGESLDGCFVVRCGHGYAMHEDVCNDEHAGLDDPCPVGRRSDEEIVESFYEHGGEA